MKIYPNIPARGKRESIRIENGDMTNIITEPPVITDVWLLEAFYFALD